MGQAGSAPRRLAPMQACSRMISVCARPSPRATPRSTISRLGLACRKPISSPPTARCSATAIAGWTPILPASSPGPPSSNQSRSRRSTGASFAWSPRRRWAVDRRWRTRERRTACPARLAQRRGAGPGADGGRPRRPRTRNRQAPGRRSAHGQVASGTSVGVAFGPKDARDAAALMRAADLALYSAKRGGRPR